MSLEIELQLLLRHPMLEGILLSECVRLQQQPLANKLIDLLHRFYSRESRHKLVLLCWYDLMLGNR
ncbi:hypothetical protein [Yersinia intermedia]|uniref:hypothetical protein n=1 Tax=Yersinia intermedia TaxID=631 RepID=UPI001124F7C3|nr:hypothetical protein [Yersinia intermedia]